MTINLTVATEVEVSFLAKDGSFNTVEKYHTHDVNDMVCWKLNEWLNITTSIKSTRMQKVYPTRWGHYWYMKQIRTTKINQLFIEQRNKMNKESAQ